MPKNVIQHIEWTTRDPQRLMDFFERIFDWNFFEAMPGYTMIEGVGGVFAAPDAQMPAAITPYVNVGDLALIEDRVDAAGGKVHKSKQEVPGRGWYSVVSDPDGNLLGLWQALMPAPAAGGRTTRGRARKPAKKAARKSAAKAARKGGGRATTKAAKKPTRKTAAKRARR